MPNNLLIVESPAKARTIKKYLGADFEVLATYGHVRDLRPKEGAVEPENGFRMHYEQIERNLKHVQAIARALRKADTLYLATDPDREGEAIAWHLAELLGEQGMLEGKSVRRVVFHEITRKAVRESISQARTLSRSLIDAQQARRALDYLVGFNLSPLLWRKIRRGLSAGRVQSPALRMIVEREEEIERFEPREYWTIDADLAAGSGDATVPFTARLNRLRGEKVSQFTLTDQAQARAAREHLERAASGAVTVLEVEKKQRKRYPVAPFTTSTLQQEAVRKLGFTAQRAMRVAQGLYEGVDTGGGSVGLITYMRTDSVNLAAEAVAELREFIGEQYGGSALPEKPPRYKTRAKNAQEAHEAVRPTSVARTPASLRDRLNRDQYRLYELIWKRAVASQMKHATLDTVAVELGPGPEDRFRVTGSTVADPGFLAVYEEGEDDASDALERRLPPLAVGDRVTVRAVHEDQHFTEPPPRYSEATLVRALEDFGIGRPSTYASIIATLLQREYAVLESRRFRPTDVGRLVNGFLTEHFSDYVDYDFTARLEDDLDAIARGEMEWVPVMGSFWNAFSAQVKDKDDRVTRGEVAGARELGVDPKTGAPVSVRLGRFGPYAQIGSRGDAEKPRFASLRPGQSIATIGLAEALDLFRLPRALGQTADGEPVSVGIGRFGPYVKYGSRYASLGKEDDPYEVTLERALELVAEKVKAEANRRINEFEEEGIKVLNGRYGPYVTDGKRNARVPKERDPAGLSLEDCKALLEKAPAPKGKRRATKVG